MHKSEGPPHSPPSKEEFLHLLRPNERKRVRTLLGIIDSIPLGEKDWIWAIGTGSLARRSKEGTNIEVLVFVGKNQMENTRRFLREALFQQHIQYPRQQHLLPNRFLIPPQPERVFGKNIELLITPIEGAIPAEFIEYQSQNRRIVELLRKGVPATQRS